jgi:Family of unknown function (DUF5681)
MAKSSTSFEKGNQAGIDTRFARGQTGNAGGRPKWKPITDAIRARLALTVSEYFTKEEIARFKFSEQQTKLAVAELMADRFIRATLAGNSEGTRQFRELLDRIEGRVPLPLVNGEDGGFTLNLVSHIPRPDRTPKPSKPVKAPKKNVQ